MHTTLIGPEELNKLSAADVRIFDVRHDLANIDAGEQAFRQSRIPSALFLHVHHVLSGARTSGNGRHPLPERDEFYEAIVRAGVSSNTQVVAYDAQGGMFAARLWWMLRWLGHERVAVLDGGWQAWQPERLPIDDRSLAVLPDWPGQVAGQLPLASSLVDAVNTAQVLSNIEDPKFVVVDAREAARFRGEIEPFDPVAGRIPGALNRPYLENLRADGCFKAPSELRDEFEALLQGRLAQSIVHQCGAGISACHNLLAMEHAGLKGSRLYPGSWSEWCSDPIRPIA